MSRDKSDNITIVNNPTGPVNTGSGDQFTGDGVVVVTSNGKGIHQTISRRDKSR